MQLWRERDEGYSAAGLLDVETDGGSGLVFFGDATQAFE